jgi:hydroxymethylbilane synthase
VLRRLRELEDPGVRLAVTAERTFLARLQGGCLVPVGAHAAFEAHALRLRGMVADLSGQPLFRSERVGSPGSIEESAALGTELADELLARGAGPVLDRVREFLRSSQAERPAESDGGRT